MGDPVIVTVPRGLQTEQSRIAGGEPVLIDAENVVCRRPGLVEPRGQLRSWSTAVSGTPVHVRRWTNPATPTSPAFYCFTGNTTSDTLLRIPEDGSATSGSLITTGRVQSPRSADFGDRLAWAFDDGIAMIDSASSGQRAAGVPAGPAPQITADYAGTPTQEWFPATGSVAYRTCVVRMVNGRPVRGAPSARVIFAQAAVGTCFFVIEVPTLGLQATDTVELYRTQVNTVSRTDPGDEMRLRYTWTPIGTPGSVTLIDYLPDDEWNGPYLYTNESQEGLALANGRPGTARDVALYNGMAFYAGAETRQTYAMTMRTAGVNEDPERSLTSYITSGNTTNGTPTISGLAAGDFTYLYEGMMVSLATNKDPTSGDASFQPFSFIIATDPGLGTITLSENVTGTALVDFIAWDWVGAEVDGGLQAIFAYPAVSSGPVFGAVVVASDPIFGTNPAIPVPGPYLFASAGNVQRAWDAVYFNEVSNTGAFDNVILRLATFDIGTPNYANTENSMRGVAMTFSLDVDYFDNATYATGQTFKVRTSKPLAFYSPTDLSWNVGATSYVEGGPATLTYSKVDLPESVPFAFRRDIGGADYPIRRIVATTDSLWVLKGDGLWRVYGDDPAALALQQVDPTCRMFGRDTQRFDRWVTSMGDTVFAWTDLGIVAISAGGVQRIDDPIRTMVRKYTPSAGQTVTLPWSWSSLSTGTIAIGFDSHEYRDEPLGFVYDVPSGTWSTMSTSNIQAVMSDVVTVNNGEPVTVGGEAVTI